MKLTKIIFNLNSNKDNKKVYNYILIKLANLLSEKLGDKKVFTESDIKDKEINYTFDKDPYYGNFEISYNDTYVGAMSKTGKPTYVEFGYYGDLEYKEDDGDDIITSSYNIDEIGIELPISELDKLNENEVDQYLKNNKEFNENIVNKLNSLYDDLHDSDEYTSKKEYYSNY